MLQVPEELQHLEALIKRLTDLNEVHSVGEQIAEKFGYQAGCLATYRGSDQVQPYTTYCYGESADVLKQDLAQDVSILGMFQISEKIS